MQATLCWRLSVQKKPTARRGAVADIHLVPYFYFSLLRALRSNEDVAKSLEGGSFQERVSGFQRSQCPFDVRRHELLSHITWMRRSFGTMIISCALPTPRRRGGMKWDSPSACA